MEKKEKLRKRLYKMVDEFVEVCDLDSEYYLVEKNDYTTKIMEQEVRDMASNIELDKAREEGRREGSEITSRYISDFVKSESGKSGRKEILEYIEELSKLKQ